MLAVGVLLDRHLVRDPVEEDIRLRAAKLLKGGCVGILLEERDLVDLFGDDYRRYKARVSMLVPWR